MASQALMRARFVTAAGPVCVLVMLVFFNCAWGQLKPKGTALPTDAEFLTNSAHSFSGQFVVRAAPGLTGSGKMTTTNQDSVQLQPTLATVSCERIKQLLSHELNTANSWRGKIYILLVPSNGGDHPVTIMSERFRDNWQYRVELPDLIERGRYVRAIVQVLLLEFANRTPGGHSAEIPDWLSEGFAQQLLACNELEIILPPPRSDGKGSKLTATNVSARRNNPVEKACAALKSRSPLTFHELSWPAEDQWSGESAQVYRSSAQLFLYELMQLNEGRESLRTMLSKLPQRLNWQLAFLDSFHSSFQRALDVEKWWALQMVHLGRRDVEQQTWSFEESQRKLDEALHASLEIHTGTNDLPIHTSVSLSTVIRDSDHLAAGRPLESNVRELELLRARIATEFIPLLDKYHQVLETFLQRQGKSGKKASQSDRQEAIAQLEQLDALRAMVQPRQKAVASSKP